MGVFGWLLGVAGVVGVLGSVFVTVLRTKYRPALRPLLAFQRDRMNPMQLRRGAGGEGAYASVVHHVGRRSGKAYRTPVVVVDTEEGLLIALPYGPEADWAQNVLAAGGATIQHEGRRVEVAHPEVIGTDRANRWFSQGARLNNAVFGVRQFLLLRPTDRSPSAG